MFYEANDKFDDYAYFKQSPSVVLIDTTVIAEARNYKFLESKLEYEEDYQ